MMQDISASGISGNSVWIDFDLIMKFLKGLSTIARQRGTGGECSAPAWGQPSSSSLLPCARCGTEDVFLSV